MRQLQLREVEGSMQKRQDAIIADMTRQYKSTDEEMRELQVKLEQRIEENDS